MQTERKWYVVHFWFARRRWWTVLAVGVLSITAAQTASWLS